MILQEFQDIVLPGIHDREDTLEHSLQAFVLSFFFRDIMLQKIAESYDNEVESMVTAMTSILEPVMIVAMAGIIFFMIIAILLPIFQMNQLVR